MQALEIGNCCSAKVLDGLACLYQDDSFSKQQVEKIKEFAKNGEMTSGTHASLGNAYASFMILSGELGTANYNKQAGKAKELRFHEVAKWKSHTKRGHYVHLWANGEVVGIEKVVEKKPPKKSTPKLKIMREP